MPSHPANERSSKFRELACENPTRSLLVAVGFGLALGLLVRTLRPHTPESRMTRLLDDVRDRLHDIAVPIRRGTESLVETGTDAVKSGVAHFQDLHLDRGLKNLGKRIKGLFR